MTKSVCENMDNRLISFDPYEVFSAGSDATKLVLNPVLRMSQMSKTLP